MTNKKDHILDAALILFSERGYDGTTIPMIADKAKVGAGTIYRYFDNKEYLVNYLFQYHTNRLSESLKSDFPSETTNFREKHRHLFFKIIKFAKDDIHVLNFIDSNCNAIYLTEESSAQFEVFLQFLRDILEKGKQENIIRPITSNALIAIVYGAIIQLYKLIGMGAIEEAELQMEEIEDCCWNAIKVN